MKQDLERFSQFAAYQHLSFWLSINHINSLHDMCIHSILPTFMLSNFQNYGWTLKIVSSLYKYNFIFCV